MVEQQIAYQLKWDLTEILQWPDDKYCAELPENVLSYHEKDEILGKIWSGQAIDLPAGVLFESNDELVKDCDYPYTDARWPIMSERMIDILTSVGDFPHQVIPVTFQERRLFDSETHPELEARPDGWAERVTRREFYLFNLLELQDVFDWDKSEYQIKQGRLVISVRKIKRLVFRAPPEGLPPIFRPKELETCLFVSNAAKEALEKAGVKGARFVPQRKYR